MLDPTVSNWWTREHGENLAAIRKERGFASQDALARRIGRSTKTVSNWERGLHGPTEANLQRLAEAMSIDATALLEVLEPAPRSEDEEPRSATSPSLATGMGSPEHDGDPTGPLARRRELMQMAPIAGLLCLALAVGFVAWRAAPSPRNLEVELDLVMVDLGQMGPAKTLVGPTEVTQRLYDCVMGHPPEFDGCRGGGAAERGPQYPAVCVSWFDAVLFANMLSARSELDPAYTFAGPGKAPTWNRAANGFRLPTDQEWEALARAKGLHQGHYLGTKEKEEANWRVCQYANVADDSARAAHGGLFWNNPFPCDDGYPRQAPVGSLAPNDLGLFDMQGNVHEWVWDNRGDGRGFRGGSWGDGARHAAIGALHGESPSVRDESIGLRLVRSALGGAAETHLVVRCLDGPGASSPAG